ncbi:MAG: hypothetical protein QGI83_23585 [Candidatus Latescibacteria bacterium]|nr:hypothetical protein [Candidatus Latescibacterota bacterium]
MPGSFKPRPAEDVHDELLTKALVLDNGETRVAMITCDLICMPQKVSDAAKSRISERCGIPPEHVMINGTHSHSAAAIADLLGVDENEEYTAWVPLKIADAAELALRRLRPARIGFASVQEDRIAFCRRWRLTNDTVRMNPGRDNPDLIEPVSPTDPELAMLYVESRDGDPISAIANYSLHYVGTDGGGAISADYFGHFYRLMRHYLGGDCVPLLWNGASGQINNNDYGGSRQWEHRGHAQASRMANVLAGHLITEIQLMDMHESLELGGAVGTLEFPRKAITAEDLEVSEKILTVPDGSFEDYDSGPFSWVVGQTIPSDRVATYARECVRLARLPERMTTPVQALRLGDSAVVGLPGEIFVEIALNIRSRAKASPLFVVSLANGYIGYVCTDHALTREGGYETWAGLSSLGGVGTAPAMENLASSLLDQLGL